ncbi:MAG: YdiU family protein, partial [Hyphomonadaceae bacterium]|nr:YdiU family protein [Hyphomonadaceae bacterium]
MLRSHAYHPDPQFRQLGAAFADPVQPAPFPLRLERFFNHRWAAEIGLDRLDAAAREAHFARFTPLADNMAEPLAMRYHGHQFRVYNPDIGDGRGFLFAQLRDRRGRLLDLATKGSGRTPYSRRGDGRLTLKGGVREVLAASMLEAQGVYTSKAFALFETGEALERSDEPSPTRSAVLTRLGHSHIRFGTFQRLAYFAEADLIRALLAHCVDTYFPELGDVAAADLPGVFLARVAQESARLAASWMAAGFVHGVLNSDNMVITGESFDYGPWRFLPSSDPGFTAAYFDHSGLYAFGRQPEAVGWNLAQLAGALSLVSEQEALLAALNGYGPAYSAALVRAVHTRLGLAPTGDQEADLAFLQALFGWMAAAHASWAQTFHDWFAGAASAARAAASPQAG